MPLTKVKYGMIDDEAIALLGAGAKTTTDVIAGKEIGYLNPGDTVAANTTLQHLVEQILTTTYYPSTVEPLVALSSSNQASLFTSAQEAGTALSNIYLTATYTKGKVLGVLGAVKAGVWAASSVQSDSQLGNSADNYTGAAGNYTFSGPGITTTTGASNTYTAYSTPGNLGDSALIMQVQLAYAAGTYIPHNSLYVDGDTTGSHAAAFKDATGTTYTVHANGTVTATLTINPYRKLFYGAPTVDATMPSVGAALADNSSVVRGLANSSTSTPSDGNTFTITPVVGSKYVMFAYPASLRDVTRVLNGGTNLDDKSAFTKVTCNIYGANSTADVSYKVYYFKPPQPYATSFTYTVTI